MVLTNLQRGNIPTETPAPEQTDVSLHHRAGLGEITEQDIEQGTKISQLFSTGFYRLSIIYFEQRFLYQRKQELGVFLTS